MGLFMVGFSIQQVALCRHFLPLHLASSRRMYCSGRRSSTRRLRRRKMISS